MDINFYWALLLYGISFIPMLLAYFNKNKSDLWGLFMWDFVLTAIAYGFFWYGFQNSANSLLGTAIALTINMLLGIGTRRLFGNPYERL